MSGPPVGRALRLDAKDYVGEQTPKSLVVLHHTVGGSVASTVRWWRSDPARVATAYIIERDGGVFEVFPPECWAYHLKAGDASIDRRSIGIELASEGALRSGGELTALARANGESHRGWPADELFAFDVDWSAPRPGSAAPLAGARSLGKTTDLLGRGRVLDLGDGFRGYRFFDAYDEPQVVSAIKLVAALCSQFGIPRRLPADGVLRGQADARGLFAYEGVLHHAVLRRDKTDLHPGFPWWRLRRYLEQTAPGLSATAPPS